MLIWLCLWLAACAARPVAQYARPDPAATIHPVHVATLRQMGQPAQNIGAARQPDLHFFRADISVPETHATGKIEWPDGTPHAETDFVMTGTQRFGGLDAMLRDMRQRAAKEGLSTTEAMLYVHGYNNSLSEAMYRMAQIEADFDTKMPGLLFSWPSAGDPKGYVYDRDSVLYSRDALLGLLKQMSARPGQKVFLLAHSMGAQLVMEVLRQAVLQGDRQVLSHISGVVLISPDIDPDLFRQQAKVIGKLPQPFLIFVSSQDRALSLSSFLSGRKTRLGLIESPEALEGLDVRLIDFTELSDGEGLGHFTPVTSPAAIEVLNGMIKQATHHGTGFIRNVVLRLPPIKALKP